MDTKKNKANQPTPKDLIDSMLNVLSPENHNEPISPIEYIHKNEIKDVVFSHPTIQDVTFKGVSVPDFVNEGNEYYIVPISTELENSICDVLGLSGGKVTIYKKRSVGFSMPCPIKIATPNK